MFVIAVYDISTLDSAGRKRLVKVMKTMRKYLHHSQKSVFEGEITEAKFYALRSEIEKIIDKSEDYVVFFTIPWFNGVERINVGKDFDPNSNIL
ncbi:MAG TPA: CRISPR-associated endonuclease Cas2 [Spirochaetota bacterium]|jgi:CRISPR-associated protein Cas2|nr:CRISPR-associated endonuclease Cas2 [Spirochaetota bacterium]HPD79359.1 CRISPR-associated endonuclease Cas2 [Spirochaetota bacterium]